MGTIHSPLFFLPETYRVELLHELFEKHVVLTLEMIAEQLGTRSRTTLFRKLRAVDYRASYSHRGMHYVLNDMAEYDDNGLWVYHGIRFSRFGSLSHTVCELVKNSEDGRFADELHSVVQIPVYNTLAIAHRRGQLERIQLGSEYVYLWPSIAESQLQSREARLQAAAEESICIQEADGVHEAMRLLLWALNEKQRRLYMGVESIRIGIGGDKRVAELIGVDIKSVAKGRRELQSRNVNMDRIRSAGAGRPALKRSPR